MPAIGDVKIPVHLREEGGKGMGVCLPSLVVAVWLSGASEFSVGRLGRYGYNVEAKEWGVGKRRVLRFWKKEPEEMRRPHGPKAKAKGEATWWLCFGADWADLRLGTSLFRLHQIGRAHV